MNASYLSNALQIAIRKSKEPFKTTEDTLEIDHILEQFIQSVPAILADGATKVHLMTLKTYGSAQILHQGPIELNPKCMNSVARGVFTALADAGYKPVGHVIRERQNFIAPRDWDWTAYALDPQNYYPEGPLAVKEIVVHVDLNI